MSEASETLGEFTDKTPRCPRRGCGAFMASSHDEYGMPGAKCGKCGAPVGASWLIENGYYREA